ncbi:MAG: zinc-ribbon domain-containing protein [Alphaproteobacteria bacterium]|jgi:predicted Zn finger-like uncharacterized protein|nr:zinc-ribbon domain-containing protein [Alphaproteobacteria bacterium]
MILSCPSCATRFTVPEGAFASGGRKLRCGKCKHDWFQEPPAAPEQASPVVTAASVEAVAPSEAPAMDEENSQDDIDALFDSPDPQEENFQDDIDAMFDAGDPQKENSQDDVDAMFASDAPSEENSQDDVDAMFETAAGDDEGADDDEEPSAGTDDAPPIGIAGGAAIRGTQTTGGSWVGWTAMVSVLVAIVAGLALLSDTVIEAWPPAKRLYAMVGLPFTTLGEGLEIRNIEARFEPGPNGSRLIIMGDIANVTRHARTVPMVRVVLRDESGAELEGWMFQATDLNMMPSETVSFRTAHESPPDGAMDALLGFTEAPVEAAASEEEQESAAAE